MATSRTVRCSNGICKDYLWATERSFITYRDYLWASNYAKETYVIYLWAREKAVPYTPRQKARNLQTQEGRLRLSSRSRHKKTNYVVMTIWGGYKNSSSFISSEEPR
jgi:hypothetical protein